MVKAKKENRKKQNILVVGWREWVALPGLGLPAIKAKIDTGARTSSLHTFDIELFKRGGVDMVRFGLHPLQRSRKLEKYCEARLVEKRRVSDSGGHVESRVVIRSDLHIGSLSWPIEITLTNRDTMNYRMLLGRTAMIGNLVVDPERSYLTGRKLAKIYKEKIRNA